MAKDLNIKTGSKLDMLKRKIVAYAERGMGTDRMKQEAFHMEETMRKTQRRKAELAKKQSEQQNATKNL